MKRIIRHLPTTALAFLIGIFAGTAAQAQTIIYRYVDADGFVHYTNRPVDARYQPRVVVKTLSDTHSRTPAPSSRAARVRYQDAVAEAAETHGLEKALLNAVITVESGFNARSVSPKGAMGLMQLMPATAKRYGANDPFDPKQNLNAGAKYLKDLLAMFDNDVHLALAAYNAGEHAVLRYGRKIPPYRETRHYVPAVLRHLETFRRSA
jgi:soluble lytic murein transglycosylase-like protein